jgi:hypothetical protein
MQPAYEQLAQHWQRSAVNLAGAASPKAIRAFEVSHQLAFPSDFREYLIHLGGMNGARGDETDSKLFSFWPLAEMRSVAAEYPGEEFPPNHPPSPDCCIVFADFMIDSHHFALRCAPAHPAARAQSPVREPVKFSFSVATPWRKSRTPLRNSSGYISQMTKRFTVRTSRKPRADS